MVSLEINAISVYYKMKNRITIFSNDRSILKFSHCARIFENYLVKYIFCKYLYINIVFFKYIVIFKNIYVVDKVCFER